MSDLSLTGRRWILPKADRGGGDIVEILRAARGIDLFGEGEVLETFGHDAREFLDYKKAAERIRRAVMKKERVAIFGDYDCDGITGTAILARFFRRRTINPMLRLPHRSREGYGLKIAHVEEFARSGVQLIITVDTGITAKEPIAHAQKLGMDVIVVDHHSVPEVLPNATALFHPAARAVPMAAPPCGAGLAWTLVHALEAEEGNAEWDDWETDIALAAVGTIADVVELRGGNRSLVHRGLFALHQLGPGPLQLLCMQAGMQPPYRSRDIAFRIAPRINAAGRMDDPHIALSALLGNEQSLLALESLNRDRQDLVESLMEELMAKAENDERSFLLYADERFSPGICGLLAGRLTERFGKPALIASKDDDLCMASLRSIAGYDVTAALNDCARLLKSFGGHAMAAGCSFTSSVTEELTDHLCNDVLKIVSRDHLVPSLAADATIDASDIDEQLCERLKALEPFGQGNTEPRFLVQNVTLRDARRVGKTSDHLQATVLGKKMIGFGFGNVLEKITGPIDLLCRLSIDTWQGRRTPQLVVDDVRLSLIRERVSLPS